MKRLVSRAVVALLLAGGGLAFAQEDNRDGHAQKKNKELQDAPGFTALLAPQCFTSGSGATFLKVCITERGNISYFESPAGKVHLREREGYVMCSDFFETQGVHGFDAGIAQVGWGVPAVSQPGGTGTLPLIITRNSFDGLVQLKQTFNVIQGEREVYVMMAMKNLSTVATLPDVKLDRYFDGDIDNTTVNRYDGVSQSVLGMSQIDPNFQNGMMLTLAPSSVVFHSEPHPQTFEQWNPLGSSLQLARECRGNSTSGTPRDFVGRLSTFVGDILPGQTKTVTFRYRRF